MASSSSNTQEEFLRYISTRNKNQFYSDSTAILNNFADDGGMFVPEEFPRISENEWMSLARLPFNQFASKILQKFLANLPAQKLDAATNQAYASSSYKEFAPELVKLNEYSEFPYSLELWHGNGGSYLDFIARLVPELYKLTHDRSADRVGKKLFLVLPSLAETAYSWVHAFDDLQIDSIVFAAASTNRASSNRKNAKSNRARRGRKSKRDSRNKTNTISLENYSKADLSGSVAVNSTLSDLQSSLLDSLNDEEFIEKLESENIVLQVVTDYSWAIILCQIIYFARLYALTILDEDFDTKDLVDVVIPSANLSNVLACLYTKASGTNFNKIILSSNKNHLWTDFVRNGIFNARRRVYQTNSPGLDLAGSENLQRLLFEFAERDSEKVNAWMDALESASKFSIDKRTLGNMQILLSAGFADDANTRQEIINVYTEFDHVVDPHTAVGHAVKSRIDKNLKDEDRRKTVYASLYSPYLFPNTVADALINDAYKYKTIDELRLAIFKESDLDIPIRFTLANAYKDLYLAEEALNNESRFYGEEVEKVEEVDEELAKKTLENAKVNLDQVLADFELLDETNTIDKKELAEYILYKLEINNEKE